MNPKEPHNLDPDLPGQNQPAQPDPLEIKLQRLRPKPMSQALRNRIADAVVDLPDDLTGEAARPGPKYVKPEPEPPVSFLLRPSLRVWFGVAAGVVCVISVGVAVHAILNPPPPRGPQSAMAMGPDAQGAATRSAPTLLKYLKAASENDEALDTLLDRDARILLNDKARDKDSSTTQPK